MESIHNVRSRQYYSAKEVSQYAKDAPEGQQYKVYQETIQAKCLQSKDDFAVLELGCGTGRYFFYLSNVKKLKGVDISENMILAASENIKRIPALQKVTEFVHSSIEDFQTTEKFDLIYSIGTLGECCEFNAAVLQKAVSFLKPNGLFFFTIVDAESYVKREYVGPRKRLMRFAVRMLPMKWRMKVDGNLLVVDDWKSLFLSKKQVETILKSSPTPIKWELSKAKDDLHVHHIVKVWLADAMLQFCPIIESVYFF